MGWEFQDDTFDVVRETLDDRFETTGSTTDHPVLPC